MVNRLGLKAKRGSVRWWTLRELREHYELSQGDLATLLDGNQPAIKKAENSSDPRVSTIERFVEGIARSQGVGHDVFVMVTIGDTDYRLRIEKGNEAFLPLGSDAVEPPGPSEVRAEGTAWRLRAWDDPDLEVEWHDRRIITMSEDEIGDLTDWPTESQLQERLASFFTDRKPQAIGMFTTYWRYFCKEMAIGDVVAVPQSRKRVGIARITGDYRYVGGEPDQRMRHQRAVEWLRTIPRADLDDDIRKVVNAPGTICQIKAPRAATRLV